MGKKDDFDEALAMAIHRYEVISAYIAIAPARGKRRALLQLLADRPWTNPRGDQVRYSVETLRKWVRRYNLDGLEGLKDTKRPTPGCQVLTPEIIDTACRLKREVPERSVERIIRIMEQLEYVETDLVKKSTLHRVLQAHGLSARKLNPPEDSDLDRWQADHANDLWQADMLQGPWLPDPSRPGKMKRAYLYAFIDDASRLLLFGRFSFKEGLPALELVMRRALQRWGVPARVYYDNGMVFRSHHMKAICARLGIHRPIHTKAYRPPGHGKIEAFNRFCRNAFISEVKASNISTIAELNEAFVAWLDEEYNRRPHTELGNITPLARFLQDADFRRYADEEDLRQAFLWREKRTADKCGVIKLFNIKYQCSPALAKRKIEVRFDPEHLDVVELWRNDRFEERVSPLEMTTHRRGKQKDIVSTKEKAPPVADWLGHLVEKRRKKLGVGGVQNTTSTNEAKTAFVTAIRSALHPDVFDEQATIVFFERFGPFSLDEVTAALEDLVADGPADHHLSYYFDELLKRVRKGQNQ